MKFRAYTISAVAALALAAPAAQGATLTAADGPTASAASHNSAAAPKAMDLRYQATPNVYNVPAYNEWRNSRLGSGNTAAGSNHYPSAYVAVPNPPSVPSDDRVGIRGIGKTPSPSPTPVDTPRVAPQNDGFEWGYTALGAAAMLLIATAFVGVVRLSNVTRNAQRSLRTG